MKTSIVATAIIALLVGIGVGIFVVSSVNSGRMMGEFGQGSQSNVDKHFIEEMIPHHEGAIKMAELALQRSTREDVLTLSRDIIEAQTKEIIDMRAWYREWFGADVPEDSSMMGMGHGAMGHMQGMEGDLEALSVAPDFDSEFLSQMIVHHEMAVMMARMLASGTERDQMKTLADSIITSQNREILMMGSWLAAL